MVTEQPEGQEPVVEQVKEGAPEGETPAPTPAPAPTPVEVTLEQVQAAPAYRNIQAENDRLRAEIGKNQRLIQEVRQRDDAALLAELGDEPKVRTLLEEKKALEDERAELGPDIEQAKKIRCAQSIAKDYSLSYDTLMAADVKTGPEMEAYAKALKAVGGLAPAPAPTETPTTPAAAPTTPARQPALEHTPDAAIATQQPLQGWPQVQEAYGQGEMGEAEYKKQAAIHGKEP